MTSAPVASARVSARLTQLPYTKSSASLQSFCHAAPTFRS